MPDLIKLLTIIIISIQVYFQLHLVPFSLLAFYVTCFKLHTLKTVLIVEFEIYKILYVEVQNTRLEKHLNSKLFFTFLLLHDGVM